MMAGSFLQVFFHQFPAENDSRAAILCVENFAEFRLSSKTTSENVYSLLSLKVEGDLLRFQI
jgi:hypothetical protein